jgi:hypothetical protein
MDAHLEFMHGEIFERALHCSEIQFCITGLLGMALSVLALPQGFQTFSEIHDYVPAHRFSRPCGILFLVFRWILNEGLSEYVLKIYSVLFGDHECAEILSQQLCLALLNFPGDNSLIEKLLLFGDQILMQCRSICPVHMFQLVASLMIFGISAQEFEGLSEFYIASMRHLARVKKFDELRPQKELPHFHHIWETALEKLGVRGDFSTILRKMFETDRTF